MPLKPEELAAMRSRLFRASSSRARSGSNTDQVINEDRKKENIGGKKHGSMDRAYSVTVSVPWGGSRRYLTLAESIASAIARAIRRDNRIDAAELGEMILTGARRVEGEVEPPLRPYEVRLITNTER